MKNKITFLQVLLATFLFQNIAAQIDRQFEFIDHRSRTTAHLESKIVNDDLVYVAANNTRPMTSVNYVNSVTNQIDTILATYYGFTDLNEFSDGSFDIYLHSMFDYDVCVSGFFHVSYDGAEFKVDTLHSYILWDGSDSDIYPHSATKTRDGNYYMIDFDSLYFSDGYEATGLIKSNYEASLFQNDALDVFIFENNSIVKINENTFDTVQILSSNIIDIENRGAYNDVLLPGSIQTWNDDFSVLMKTWSFEDEIESFYEVNVGETFLTILTSDENQYSYRKIASDGTEIQLDDGVFQYEEAKGFHFLSDSMVLMVNAYLIEDIKSDQLLFRNHGFGRVNIYEDRMASIDTATIIYKGLDTLYTWVNSAGDTMHTIQEHYDVDIQYTNNSGTSIEHVNVHSSDVFVGYYYFNGPSLNYAIKDELQPNESYNIQSIYSFFDPVETITFGIPGADYRINNDPNRLFVADVILDVPSVTFDPNLKLYPNPAYNQLNIELEGRIEELAIYNAQGQLMLMKIGNNDLSQVDISALQAGAYYIKLRIKGEKGYLTQKFVKI